MLKSRPDDQFIPPSQPPIRESPPCPLNPFHCSGGGFELFESFNSSGEHKKERYELGKQKSKRDVSKSTKLEPFWISIWSTKVDSYWPYSKSRSWSMDSNLPAASFGKNARQVGPPLLAYCARNLSLLPKQLGRKRVLPGAHRFLSFRHRLQVRPLEWKETTTSDVSRAPTRNRLLVF